MNAAAARVLLVDPRPSVSDALRSDLALAGFEVDAQSDPRRAAAAARTRPPDAIVMPYALAAWSWRRLEAGPGLRDVPVVAITPGSSRVPAPVLFGPFLRAHAYVASSEMATPGAVAAAVRSAIARGPLPPPTPRERLGRALWNGASALAATGLVLTVAAAAADLLAGWRAGPLRFLVLYGAALVLMDVAVRLALGLPLGLRPRSLFWLALIAAAVASGALLQAGR